MVPNGVGPTQLTSSGLQDQADAEGGCWRLIPNMKVGFRFLHQLQTQHGVRNGFKSYNGSGRAAEEYADRAVQRANVWKGRFDHVR
jgi:hypothetical protein